MIRSGHGFQAPPGRAGFGRQKTEFCPPGSNWAGRDGAGGGDSLVAVRLASFRETGAWGRALGKTARGGEILDLRGPFGAGKTTAAQGVLRGLVGPGTYRSPSFDLIHVYRARPEAPEVFHVDLDRVEPARLVTIGLEDLFGPSSVVILEHGEVAEDRLPSDRLECLLARGRTPGRRVCGIRPRGPVARAWLGRAFPRLA